MVGTVDVRAHVVAERHLVDVRDVATMHVADLLDVRLRESSGIRARFTEIVGKADDHDVTLSETPIAVDFKQAISFSVSGGLERRPRLIDE